MVRCSATVVLFCLACLPARAEERFHYPEAKYGAGELKYHHGIPVLTVSGTPEEIGEQVGTLAVKPLAPKLNLLKEYIEQLGPVWPLAVRTCEGVYKQFPPEYRQEIEAMARAGGVKRELLIVANTVGDVQHLVGCSVLVAGPSRSATGTLLFGRNFDFRPIDMLAQTSLLVVCRPKGKHAFASISFPGVLMSGTAMNDAGLVLAGNDARAPKDGATRLNLTGTPMAVVARHLMEDCATVADARKYLCSIKATTTCCAIVADTKEACVFEVTPKTVAIRGAEEGLTLCTNHYRTEELATSMECPRYLRLEKYQQRSKLTLHDMTKALDEVNQGAWTMQSAVFEPAALKVHLALGNGPVTKQKYPLVELGPLFKGTTDDR